MQAVRDAVGPDVRIMVDAVESWSLARARRTGRILQDAGIAWLEDPVHHSDVAGLADLRRRLEVPIAGGRASLSSRRVSAPCCRRAPSTSSFSTWPGSAASRPGGRSPALAQAHRVPVCGHVVPEIQVHLLSAVAERPHGRVRASLGRHPQGDAADRERRARRTARRPVSGSSSTKRRCDVIAESSERRTMPRSLRRPGRDRHRRRLRHRRRHRAALRRRKAPRVVVRRSERDARRARSRQHHDGRRAAPPASRWTRPTPRRCSRPMRLALDTFGRLDVMMNNAGLAEPAPLDEITLESWNRVIAVTLDQRVPRA